MLVLGRAMMSEPQSAVPRRALARPCTARRADIFRTIRTINASGTSVLLVEQNARYAFETASRGYVLQTGRIMIGGSCAELAKDARVREAYLGRAAARAEARMTGDTLFAEGQERGRNRRRGRHWARHRACVCTCWRERRLHRS